jgi:hypothetical protein
MIVYHAFDKKPKNIQFFSPFPSLSFVEIFDIGKIIEN